MKDKNIMLVSMERVGSSWFGGIISEVYEVANGELPLWNHEISRQYAVDEIYPMPKGWSSVYDVNPQELLDRGYDRVIVLERNLETIKRVSWMSQCKTDWKTGSNISYDKAQKEYPEFFKNIEKYWDLVYGTKIEDPRLYWVHLDDLNRYTAYTFNEVFDWLEIPKDNRPTDKKLLRMILKNWFRECKGNVDDLSDKVFEMIQGFQIRPTIVPVNPPERNWQCFSDLLMRGHKPSETLKMIELQYATNITESQIQMRAILNHEYNIDPTINDEDIIYKYIHETNEYKMSLEEIKYQSNGSFRILRDAMVDVLDIMKISHCQICNKKFRVRDERATIEVWRVSKNNTNIIRRLAICFDCKKTRGEKIIKYD